MSILDPQSSVAIDMSKRKMAEQIYQERLYAHGIAHADEEPMSMDELRAEAFFALNASEAFHAARKEFNADDDKNCRSLEKQDG